MITTTKDTGINWIRVIVALVLAELLPIVLAVAVVLVAMGTRERGSMPPGKVEPPRVGNWVLPMGAIVATTLLSWWAARGAVARHFAHGAIVGAGTAVVDVVVTLGAGYAMTPIFLLSTGGRIVAGALGGWLGGPVPETGKPAHSDFFLDKSRGGG